MEKYLSHLQQYLSYYYKKKDATENVLTKWKKMQTPLPC